MEKINKKDIRLQTKEALQDFFVSHGAPSFKGGQVYQWLWQKGAHDFDIMTNLSLEHRNILKSEKSNMYRETRPRLYKINCYQCFSA